MNRKAVVAGVAALSLGVGLGFVPVASADQKNAPATERRAVLKSATQDLKSYSDFELLQLLLAAQGPIADEHPELKRILGFDPSKPRTDEKALAAVIRAYLAYNPQFHRETAKPLQSGNPRLVDAGLRRFATSFNEFAKINSEKFAPKGAGGDAQARGWFWMGANVAVYANAAAVANAVVYANAGVATFALATLAVVTWYLEDGSPAGSSFERDHFIKTLTDALA